MPLVSVLLPVWNCERFVFAAVESVRRQTEKDFELIVLDDGSSDGSLATVERAAAGDARVRVYSRRNKGLVPTLNECVGLSRAPWIARMDADDVCEPARLATQLAFCRATGTAVCGSAVRMFSRWTAHVRSYPASHEDVIVQLAMGTAFAHPSVFGKAECFRAHRYLDAFPHAEDYDLWTRFALAGYRVANIGQPLLRYRVNPKQVSRVHRAAQFVSSCAISMAFRRALVDREPMLCDALRAEPAMSEALERNPGEVESSTELAALARLLARVARLMGVREAAIGDYLCYLARNNRRIRLRSVFSALAAIAPHRATGRALSGLIAHRIYLDRLHAIRASHLQAPARSTGTPSARNRP